MVSKQTAAGHSATAAPSTSSIKPTGWIRSTSASGSSASGRSALGDRTNLPSANKATPLCSLPKPTAHSAGRRSITPARDGAASRQQRLSSFFAPSTAPPAASRLAAAGPSVLRQSSSALQDSPSVVRARARSSNVDDDSNDKVKPDGLDDDDLEARAASLLRGRFGSVSRSLNTSRSSTPTRAPSPPPSSRVDAEPSRSERASRPRCAMPPPPPQVQKHSPTLANPGRPAALQETPPRLAQQPQPPSSSPPFEPTLMQESLSNFSPLAWEKSFSSKWALFQRLAGVPQDEILRAQKAQMEDEVAKAHARMLASPSRSHKRRSVEQERELSPNKKSRMKQAAALPSSPLETGKRPEIVLRSPRTNRRIYALETQVGGAGTALMGGRTTTLEPMREGAVVEQRRAVSEAGRGGKAGSSCVALGESVRGAVEAEQEEESETLPLPWPVEDDAVRGEEADGTQPLAWEDEEDKPSSRQPSPQSQGDTQAEVPPSDDEDLLLQTVIASSSSSSPSPSPSPCPSPSPFASRVRSTLQTSRRQVTPPLDLRVKQESLPPSSRHRLVRTPLHSLPSVSPISLIARGGVGADRFDRVVSALKREERRRHRGTQLHLDSFCTSSRKVEADRSGLSEDLQDVLSDDEHEVDETQPLPWSSPLKRPKADPLQSSQRSTSSSSVSLPSEGCLDDAGNTQLRSFFHGL